MGKLRELYERLYRIKAIYFDIDSQKSLLSDASFVKKFYLDRTGKPIDLKNPKTFAEKLNWLKAYYHDPMMTLCADKYRLRFYVEHVLGKGYMPHILGVWSSPDEIDFNALPDTFVLKTNHDGGPIICKDKSKLDQEATRKLLAEKLKVNYYARGREWSYKNIKRLIFAESFINSDGELLDYKFFCFNGEPKILAVTSEHHAVKYGHIDYFDLDYNHLPFSDIYENASKLPKKPENLEELIRVARTLASGGNFPFVRVDLYSTGDRVYVGEMTFYPRCGMMFFDPQEWDATTGDYLTLPKKNAWRHFQDRDRYWIKKALKLKK